MVPQTYDTFSKINLKLHILVMTMLLCFALLAVVGVTHAVPEIAADGDDLVLSVSAVMLE